MSTFQTIGARATGLATIAADGTVLDTWFPVSYTHLTLPTNVP
jgi:hypothetical protein